MTFPQTPLPIKGELLIDGVWTDVTSYIRLANDVLISGRGYANEQYQLGTSQCDFTLNNRDGRFSNRNPVSPYYGLLGRNTQFRAGVTEATTFLSLPGYTGALIATGDKAVLDITSDIDIRFDFEVESTFWTTGTHTNYILGAKWFTPGNNRSWYVTIHEQGYLSYGWSADGSTIRLAQSSVPVDVTNQNKRMAIRVTHDVNNGSGGTTVTFYTSDTIAGSWTILGVAQVLPTTTSIFNSSAGVEIGTLDNGSADLNGGYYPLPGRVYSFELYQNIAGTLRAKMDATAQAVGSTGWSDGLGTPNTWTTSGMAIVTNCDYRFWGQIPKFPQRWDVSGTDIYVPVTASGLWQQLTQGAKPLDSAMRRYVLRFNGSSTEGYWPFEDGADSTLAASGIAGGYPAAVTAVTFGSDSTLPASNGAVTINDATSYIKGTFSVLPNSSGSENFLIEAKYPSALGAEVVLATINTSGTVGRWEIRVTTTGYRLMAKAPDGSTLMDSSAVYGSQLPTAWVALELQVSVSGGTITGELARYDVENADASYSLGAITGSFSGTLGRFTRFAITNTGGSQTGLKVAQIFAKIDSPVMYDGSDYFHAATGWVQEYAAQRWARLLTEEDYNHLVVGRIGDGFDSSYPGDTQRMGVQMPLSLPQLLEECIIVDRALMVERRNFFGLLYRTRLSLTNQDTVELDYSQNVFSGTLLPDEDDAFIRNDVTIARSSGSSVRAVRTEGPMNTSRPEDDPQGVGLYDTALARNAYADTQLPWLAQYEVQLGTVDELRYPKVQVNLARSVFVSNDVLSKAIKKLDVGNPFTISNLPAWLPPDDVEQLIVGYSETLGNRIWELTWNAAPYSPYRIVDLTQSVLSRYRMSSGELSGSYTTLAASLNSTANSFNVNGTGRLWGSTAKKPGNFPLLIKVGGELMSVGAISGTSYPQTFSNVTRSVNGVVKSHSSGDKVQIAEVSYMTLGRN